MDFFDRWAQLQRPFVARRTAKAPPGRGWLCRALVHWPRGVPTASVSPGAGGLRESNQARDL